MDFQSSGRPLSEQGMARVCQSLGVNDPKVWAVLTVETHGCGFLGDRRLQILFERPITRSALIQFQETRGLLESGELDDATEARLRAEAFPA